MFGLLPNDPARQKTTTNKQCTSAQRDQRSTTRGRERSSCRRPSRATTAATGFSRNGALLGMHGAVHVDADGAVLKRRSRAEARQDLLLVYPEALRSASNRTAAFTLLVLGVDGGLDLVTRVLQDRSVPPAAVCERAGAAAASTIASIAANNITFLKAISPCT